jgi:hypothetical protein
LKNIVVKNNDTSKNMESKGGLEREKERKQKQKKEHDG